MTSRGIAILLGAMATIGCAAAPAGAADALAAGRAIYMEECAICHGPAGEGEGMAGHMFQVKPRDFRRAIMRRQSFPLSSETRQRLWPHRKNFERPGILLLPFALPRFLKEPAGFGLRSCRRIQRSKCPGWPRH